MVQSLNTQAIWTLVTSMVRRPGLLVPHVSVPTISQLDFAALKHGAGISAILLDKDHTVTAPYENTAVHPQAAAGLKSCLAVFGPERVAILSNSAGTPDDVNFADAVALEESLGISVIRHVEKKPGGIAEVLKHFGLDDPSEICMVGDRLSTDVVFGNLHGMLTVHTQPFGDGESQSRDNWTAKLVRPAENALLYKDWFGSRALQRRRPTHQTWPGPDTCPLHLPASSPSDA
jgi:phosphatidylglycerophosphatase GEP4